MEPIRLELYRRHAQACPEFNKPNSRTILKCTGSRPCPLYVDGFKNGKRVRKSVGRDLERAENIRKAMERTGNVKPDVAISGTLIDLVAAFLADKKQAGACEGTLNNYKWVLGDPEYPGSGLAAFCPKPDLNDASFREVLKDFCRTQNWKTANSVRAGVIKLKTFCKWLVAEEKAMRDWGLKLPMPPDPGGQTLPYSETEIQDILSACDELLTDPITGEEARIGAGELTVTQIRQRARAIVLTMLYTGLRVSDVVRFRRDRIQWYNDPETGKRYQGITLKTQKTGKEIRLPLKQQLLDALAVITPRVGLKDGYFFLNSGCQEHVQANCIRRTLRSVATHAGIFDQEGKPDVRPHRFRDTFALALLDAGVNINDVQLLLTHESVETTQKHYQHFSSTQQCRVNRGIGSLPDFEQSARPSGVNARRNAGRNAKGNVITLGATA